MKTVLITGANGGLGSGFVDCLLKDGFTVFAVVNESIDVLPKKSNLHWIQLDVTDDEAIQRVVKQVESQVTSLDLLINNAAINKDTASGGRRELVCSLPKLDRSLILKMLNVNAISPLFVTKHFLPLLKGEPSFVINISSCRASYHDDWPETTGNYGYRGSKAALNMFTFSSLFDLPKNVKTFAVHPGDFHSAMNKGGKQEPKDQARNILSIVDKWSDDFNGKFLKYDGTLYPL